MNSNRTDPESPGEWLIEHGPKIENVMMLVGIGGSVAMWLIHVPASGSLHHLADFFPFVFVMGLILGRFRRTLQRRSRRERARR